MSDQDYYALAVAIIILVIGVGYLISRTGERDEH